MQKIKGRIVEINKNSNDYTMVVLTAEGGFLERPLPPQENFQLGDEVRVAPLGFSYIIKPLTYVAASAAIVGTLLFGSIVTMATPAYYVHVDINEAGTPSIELAVSRNLRVVETTSLNSEGSKLLTDTNFRQEALQVTMNNLMQTAQDLDYIGPEKDNTLLISIAENSNGSYKRITEVSKRIRTAARNRLETANTSATLGVATVDNSTRQQAQNNKTSINSILKKKQANGTTELPKEYEVSRISPRNTPHQASIRSPKQVKDVFQRRSDWNENKQYYPEKTTKGNSEKSQPSQTRKSFDLTKSRGSKDTNQQRQLINRGNKNNHNKRNNENHGKQVEIKKNQINQRFERNSGNQDNQGNQSNHTNKNNQGNRNKHREQNNYGNKGIRKDQRTSNQKSTDHKGITQKNSK